MESCLQPARDIIMMDYKVSPNNRMQPDFGKLALASATDAER